MNEEKFKKLTKPDKRVAIAKDVIKYIDKEKIKPKQSIYFMPIGLSRISGDLIGKQLNKIIPKTSKCEVCVLGGLLYSCVRTENDFTVPEVNGGIRNIGRSFIVNKLGKYFSEKQLALIEWAFEEKTLGEGSYDRVGLTYDKWRAAIDYAYKNKLHGPKAKMRHIMENIIKNKGTLVV